MRILILKTIRRSLLICRLFLRPRGTRSSIPSARSEAYRHLDDGFDCALLDIDVIGKSFGVAETLMRRHIPFVFVSASAPSDLPQALQQVAFIAKPFEERLLLKTVEHAVPISSLVEEPCATGTCYRPVTTSLIMQDFPIRLLLQVHSRRRLG